MLLCHPSALWKHCFFFVVVVVNPRNNSGCNLGLICKLIINIDFFFSTLCHLFCSIVHSAVWNNTFRKWLVCWDTVWVHYAGYKKPKRKEKNNKKSQKAQIKHTCSIGWQEPRCLRMLKHWLSQAFNTFSNDSNSRNRQTNHPTNKNNCCAEVFHYNGCKCQIERILCKMISQWWDDHVIR